MRITPDIDLLRKLMSYDPETGVFMWRVSRSGCKLGVPLGTPDEEGYLLIKFMYRMYKAHRLAFFIMTGECPEYVDHEDRDTGNNRWRNLREATINQNAMNCEFKPGKSGVVGVTVTKAGRFRAATRVNGKAKHLGTFATLAEAKAAYDAKAAEVHGKFYTGKSDAQHFHS